ncbi:MAG: TetR/AcrR family transcriptional regulator [Nannocystaceae bacterium]
MTKKNTTRGYHHGNLKRTLLDVAQALVAERGVDGVTMSEVAKRSGVSSGAPYRHFKDRVELLRGLAVRGQELLTKRMQAVVSAAPNPLEGFRRSGVEYIRFAVEQPVLFTVMSRGEFATRNSEAANPSDARFLDALEALLNDGDRTAPLDPTSPVLHEFAARCMVHGLAHFIVGGTLAFVGASGDQAERIADAMTRALGQVGNAVGERLGDEARSRDTA